MVPNSVPGKVQMTLGSGWPGTACTSTFPFAHPAFSNMVCKVRTRWSEFSGACCRRCSTTDLSRRRKVTLSARHALESARTTSTLDHWNMRHPFRRLEVSTCLTGPRTPAMDSTITRGRRSSAQNKKTRLATGPRNNHLPPGANQRLAAGVNDAVLLPAMRRRCDLSVVGNARHHRPGYGRCNVRHLNHAATLVRDHAHGASLVRAYRQLVAKAPRRYAGCA